MPRFQRTTLISTEDVRLTRVSCDGDDGRRPAEERATTDQLVLPLRGRFTFRDTRTLAVMSPSRALVVQSGATYTIAHPHGEGDECLAMAGTVVSPLAAIDGVIWECSAAGYARVQQLLGRLVAGEPVDRLVLEEVLYTALSPREGQPRVTRRDNAIAEAIAYAVDLHYEARLPLVRLASLAGVSVFHACRTFRSVMGTSIHRYQQEIRLRHALAMLLDTKTPLAQIAVEAGFANQGHLSNSFRRRFGSTPGQARRGRMGASRAGAFPASRADRPLA